MAASGRGAAEETRRGEKKKAHSRDRLLAAARHIFVERGYHATRPQDIAREAGVGHGTFYLHFGDKLDCFRAFVDEARAELSVLIEERTQGIVDFEERVYALLAAAMDYAEANPGVLQVASTDLEIMGGGGEMPPNLMVDEGAKDWALGVSEGMKSGYVWDDYDPTTIGYLILFMTGIATRSAGKKGTDREAILRTTSKFIVRGLLKPGALRPRPKP